MMTGASRRWVQAVLLVTAIAGGAAVAGPPESWKSGRERVVQAVTPGATRLEVAATAGFEPGAFVLVQPASGGQTTRGERARRELAQVSSVASAWLELAEPLTAAREAGTAEVLQLVGTGGNQGLMAPEVTLPWPGQLLRTRQLWLEGRAEPGTKVWFFIDGLEHGGQEVDASGRFSGRVEGALEQGPHQLQVISEQSEGWSISEVITFNVDATPLDTTPPARPVINEPYDGYVTCNPNVTIMGTAEPGSTVRVYSGNDFSSGVEIRSVVADGAGDWSFPYTFGGGRTRIWATATDAAGNTSSRSLANSVEVDNIPPDTILIPGGPAGQTVGSRTVTFTIATVEGNTFECNLNGAGFRPCTAPFAFTVQQDGHQVVLARSIDFCGNVDPTPLEITWSVDTTPPETTIDRATVPANPSNQRFVYIGFLSEEGASFQCSLNGAPFSACGRLGYFPDLANGEQVLQVRAIDSLGNVDPTPDEYRWVVDTALPDEAVLTGPALDRPLGIAVLPITLNGTAEAGSRVKVLTGRSAANLVEAGEAAVDGSGRWSFRLESSSADGEHFVKLQVRDAAGNVDRGRFTTVSFTSDIQRPDTFITKGPAEDVRTDDESPEFGFSSTEEPPVFKCKVEKEGEPREEFGSCDDLLNGSRELKEGKYTLSVIAVDRAGNEDDSPATRTWVHNPYPFGSGVGFKGCSAAGATPLLPLALLLALPRRRRQPRASARRQGTARHSSLLAMLLVLLAGTARAQNQNIDLLQYKPAPGARDMLGVYSPQVGLGDEDLLLHLGLSLAYGNNPLQLWDNTGKPVYSIISDQYVADVLASVSLGRIFELGLALPVSSQSGPDAGRYALFIPRDATGSGIGDLRIVPKARWSPGFGLDVGVAVPLMLPTANQRFLGSGVFSAQPMLLLGWSGNGLRVMGNAGVRWQNGDVTERNLRVGSELTYALGAEVPVSILPGLSALKDLSARVSLEGGRSLVDSGGALPVQSPLEVLVAANYDMPKEGLAFQLGGGPGLVDGYGTPRFRLFASVGWFKPFEFPRCPPNNPPPEDFDGFEDDDGCSEPDNDGDGLLDDVDLCPNESKGAAPDYRVRNGCPSTRQGEAVGLELAFVGDADGDGLNDAEDECPLFKGEKKECPEIPVELKLLGKEGFNGQVSFAGNGLAPSASRVLQSMAALLNTAKGEQKFMIKVGTGNSLQEQAVRDALTGSHKVAADRLEIASKPAASEQGAGSAAPQGSTTMGGAAQRGSRGAAASRPARGTTSTPSATSVVVQLIAVGSQQAEEVKVLVRRASEGGKIMYGPKPEKLEPWEAGAGKTMEVKKLGDKALVRTDDKVRAELVLSDGRVLRLDPDSELELTVDRSAQRPEVKFQVLKGALEEESADGTGLSRIFNQPDQREECKVSGTYPSGLDPVLGSFPQVPALTWAKSGASSYHVEVAGDVDFIFNLKRYPVQEPKLQPELTAGKWFWRVLPVSAEGRIGCSSKIYAFEVKQ